MSNAGVIPRDVQTLSIKKSHHNKLGTNLGVYTSHIGS